MNTVAQQVASHAYTISRANYLKATHALWKYLITAGVVILTMITVMWGTNVAGFAFLTPALLVTSIGLYFYLKKNGYENDALPALLMTLVATAITAVLAMTGVEAQYLNFLTGILGLVIIVMAGLSTKVLAKSGRLDTARARPLLTSSV